MSDEDRLDEPAHAWNSPSDAEGWMNCAGKLNAEEGLLDESSEAAAEGTMMHIVSDECLSNPLGFEPWDFIGQQFEIDGHKFIFDDDHAEALYPGIEKARERIRNGATFYGEHRVDVTEWVGLDKHGRRQKGTMDRGFITHDEIIIEDLKGGRGVAVSPVRNKQEMIYALGFWNDIARHVTKVTKFRLIIDQPRHSGGGGEWVCTLDELLAFGEEVKRAAAATKDPNAPRTAGEKQCMWCKRRDQAPEPGALTGCGTYDTYMLQFFDAEFEDLDNPLGLILPNESNLSPERRACIVKNSKLIEKWLDRIHGGLLADAMYGRPAGGLKAVQGRKNPDKYRDRDEADAVMKPYIGEKRFTKRLISPTAAAKLIPSEDFETKIKPLVVIGEMKPVLVPEEDERPALLNAESFDDLD